MSMSDREQAVTQIIVIDADPREQVREQAAKVAENYAAECEREWNSYGEGGGPHSIIYKKHGALEVAAAIRAMPLPDLPGVPDGWQVELIDAASDILDWHVYPDLKGNGDFELVTQFPSSAVNKGAPMWNGWMRLRAAILAARAAVPLPPAEKQP